jgi:hypothetical protein
MHQRITSLAKTTLGTRTAWMDELAGPLDFPPSQSLSTQSSQRAAQAHQIAMHSFSESEGNRAKSMEVKFKFSQNSATFFDKP